jgi:CheY-like chemotaxis protein
MSESPSSRKLIVLVVDDSPDGREMVVEYLTFRGFRVFEAQSGTEAVRVARRVRPHVILMDLWMPGVDGWEATRRLKADRLTNGAAIIAVTAHALPPEQESARLAGCDAVVAKPYDLTVLTDTLHRVLSKRLTTFDATGLSTTAVPRKKSSKARPS